jgi:hypothetical protein
MGQYHYLANFDRKEFIHPHVFGDGLKLMEFGASGGGTMLGLAALLAASNGPDGRGGGDLHVWDGEALGYEGRGVEVDPERARWLMENIVGRWAGERVAIIGDYHEPTDAKGLCGQLGTPWDTETREAVTEDGQWAPIEGTWRDISRVVLETIQLDYYTRQEHAKLAGEGFAGGPEIVTDKPELPEPVES